MKKEYIVIIDFDSTFVTIESLDHLARIVLSDRADKQEVLNHIVAITKQGMEGKISFPESLAKRFQLFTPNRKHLDKLINLLYKKVTPSIKRNKTFFKKNADRIYVLSGGFREYMIPLLKTYGIPEDHIVANTLLFDQKGTVIGYDKKNPLTKEKGKVKMITKMQFRFPIVMVGDGYTDYEVMEAGLARKFIAFTENVTRDTVVKNADVVAKIFEEVLENI